jgi:hypothetical protein
MERTEQTGDPAERGRGSRSRRTIASIGLVAAGLVGGAVAAGTFAAGAQTPTSTPTATQRDESKASHAGETLLTGTTAEKVRAAALKAVPGGTIQRVETDVEGSPYEVHMTNADGDRVTVKVDKDSKVTAVEEGHGGKN